MVIWRRSDCLRWRRAGRQPRGGVILAGSAIAATASGPALRLIQRLTASRCCEGRVVTSLPGLPRCLSMRRCSAQSTSFVLAALRALQVDRSCASAGLAATEESSSVWSGPAGRVVTGLVTDQGVGDLVGPVRHGAADHPALLAAGQQLSPVAFPAAAAAPRPDPDRSRSRCRAGPQPSHRR